MKLLSSNTCRTPKSLAEVTQFDPSKEADLAAIGMSAKQKETIWRAVEGLYRTGISPAITFTLRRQGHVVFNRSLGHISGNGPDDSPDASKVLAQPDTPMCLFSASKVVTAMLIHKLAEDHKIDLLAPVAHYLPAFAANGKAHVTTAHILAHRAGIPTIQGDFDTDILFDTEQVVDILFNAKPSSRSGHRAAYHAVTGGYILGELIRAVTGQDAREYLRDTIQKPLGMKYFNYGLAPEFRGEEAMGYATGYKPVLAVDWFLQNALGGDLETVVNVSNDPRFMDIICPAGNIYANADEACRFFELLLRGGSLDGQRIFDPLTIRRATLEAGKPQFDGTLLAPLRYSHGMMLGGNPVGLYGPMTGRAFGHLGFSNIFCWADPERDISVSLLTSGKPVMGPHLPALAKLLASISFNAPKVSR
ncbi:CubicO group peptidase (beta-lactamase class C family) [Paraperlucidibaca baekdonensis]|uniref:CubicO group peptidase (Beta-lactamase class C family) n=1 Tax=Paraperlucidibaca baekdonensis TaxID=748120 RepID=A0A3E0H188_9GAMM|nr:serine hydrolase domain-containing protein [Paraperlucidibaca baekdonensis]REH36823.1 CubicO group peptidase (beta-lactamase class C family) [Paraperlucidibaca baekdonensis]